MQQPCGFTHADSAGSEVIESVINISHSVIPLPDACRHFQWFNNKLNLNDVCVQISYFLLHFSVYRQTLMTVMDHFTPVWI